MTLLEDLPGGDRAGVFGPGSLAELPRVVAELGLRRVLLLTGRASFAASGADRVLPALREVVTVRVWSDFATNPVVTDVVRGAELLQSFAPDGIVAIGGGSVLDMAKLLASLGDLPAGEIPDAVRTNAVTGRPRSLVVLPTTSGSGSEATHFAVVYIGADKYSVAHRCLLPDVVIVDPLLTTSASEPQKATSVVDAIAQAVESRWARGADERSRGFADAALRALVPSAVGYVAGDAAATVEAARGSHLAGRAIDLSKTTGAHAMAYGLTHGHGISHGHAVATTLGAFARVHAAEAVAGRGHTGLADDLGIIAGLIGADGIDRVGDRLDEIAAGLGLELRLGALGVPRDQLPVMARAVNRERLANNPVELTAVQLTDLLESCY